jgi:ubiquinone/menaquinone biosynthesis C-methylase UbiE
VNHAAPFDDLAADYDQSFTATSIGQRMRAATWRRLDLAFRPGERVLELNCGTGEDAVHLAGRGVHVVATDVSPAMLAVTRAKVDRAGLASMVEVAQLRIENLDNQGDRGGFDGVLSNFGGLNCVGDVQEVARGLAAMLRPGGTAVLCLMGPAVPWEWGWYLARGQPGKALRRLRSGGTSWRGLTIRYPTIGTTRRAFAPWFEQRRVAAVGALVPPSYAGAWAARHPRLLAALDRWERGIETLPPLPWLADHYLMELERTNAPARA